MLDETTTIGLMLTLVGLLASFFWVSLGSWLRDLVALRSEAEYWKPISTPDAKKERAMIRAKADGLGEYTTGVTTVVVLGFGTFLLAEALWLANNLHGDLASVLVTALWVFLLILVSLTVFLVIRGYWLANVVKRLATEATSTQR
jgi:hypothetical protein